MGPCPPRLALVPRTLANHQSASETEVSTQCGAVSNLRSTTYVPGNYELQVYGEICDRAMRPYARLVPVTPRNPASPQ